MERDEKQGLSGKIGKASLIVMGSVLLSRVMGQVRQSYIAYVGGAGTDVDAYTIAFQIPDILNHVIAGGYLSVTFIPLFADYLEQKRQSEGWRVFSIVVTVLTVLLAVLTLVAMLTAPTLVGWVAPGYADQPETLLQAVRMTRIILPAQICFFLGGILMAVQYAQGRFLIPALAPLIYNLGIILGGVVLSDRLGIQGFSWGVLAGAFVGQFVLQCIGAMRVGMRYRPTWQLSHPDFKRFVLLTLPLILGLSMTFSMEFFFKFFGSFLGQGTVAALNYALRVGLLLVALFGQAAGVASYPFLARLYAQGSLTKLLEVLNHTIRRYLCLLIPGSVLMMVMAREIVVILFQRGAFGPEDTAQTTVALQVFLAGAFGLAAVNIVVRGYYAMKNTWLPALFGTLAVAVSVPLYWLFMRIWEGPGVALGVSVSGLIQALVLYTVFNRRTGNSAGPTYLALGRAVLLCLPLGVVAWILRAGLLRLLDGDALWGAVAICSIVGFLFVGGTLFLARLFGVQEIDQIANQVLCKLGLRKQALP